MCRVICAVGVGLALFAAAPGSIRAQQPVALETLRVQGNVYAVFGAGGNVTVQIGDEGVLMVDSGVAASASVLRAEVRKLSTRPIRFIINTHYHFDHVGGNAALQSSSAPIIAHDNVRKRLAIDTVAGNGNSVKFDSRAVPTQALPILTFDRSATVHLNGEDIQAMHFPSGHTDGDSVVYFPKSNVVHMGDDFVTYGFPFVDLQGGGSVTGMIDACEAVMKQVPADVKVIPGHGPVSSVEDVKRFVTLLKETRTVVQKAVKAGKSLDQLKQEKILAPWQKFSGQFISTDAFIETLFNELSVKKTSAPKPN